jgi:hypothetical protein
MQFANDCRQKALVLLENVNKTQEDKDRAASLAHSWLMLAILEDVIANWATQASLDAPGAVIVLP